MEGEEDTNELRILDKGDTATVRLVVDKNIRETFNPTYCYCSAGTLVILFFYLSSYLKSNRLHIQKLGLIFQATIYACTQISAQTTTALRV